MDDGNFEEKFVSFSTGPLKPELNWTGTEPVLDYFKEEKKGARLRF